MIEKTLTTKEEELWRLALRHALKSTKKTHVLDYSKRHNIRIYFTGAVTVTV